MDVVDEADIVIAIDTRDETSKFEPALSAFFAEIARLVAPIAEDKIRISVVQFSSDVFIRMSFKDGTSSRAVSDVRLDRQHTIGTMAHEHIAERVRKKALDDAEGRRPDVPAMLVILVKQQKRSTTEAKFHAVMTAAGQSAEIVIAVNSYVDLALDPMEMIRFNSISNELDHLKFHGSAEAFFRDVADRLATSVKSLLLICTHTKTISSTCYYDENGDCVSNVDIVPDSMVTKVQRRLCPQNKSVVCTNGNEGCKRKCGEVGTWSKCKCVVQGYRFRQELLR